MTMTKILFLLLLTTLTTANGDPGFTANLSKKCQVEWSAWLTGYSAVSSIGAYNKTSDWKIPAAQMESVLKGNTTITPVGTNARVGLTPAFRQSRNAVLEEKIIKDKIAQGELLPEEERVSGKSRALAITSLMEHMVDNRNPHELILTLTGADHVDDYFFARPESAVTYAAVPSRKNGPSETAVFREFLRLSGRPPIPYSDLSIPMATFSVSRYSKILDALAIGEKLTSDQILNEQNGVNPFIIFIADIHQRNETEIVNQLPSAACLKEAGITSIAYVTEDEVARKRKFAQPDLLPAVEIGALLKKKYPGKLEKAKTENPALFKLISEGNVTHAPIQLALLRRLESYEKDGLKVSYLGLESNGELRTLLLERFNWEYILDHLIKNKNRAEEFRKKGATPKNMKELIRELDVKIAEFLPRN